jgi:hypothetical protein
VIDAVVSLLRDPAKLVAMMGDIQAAEAHRRLGAATALADRLEGGSVTGRIEVLRNLVSRVVITTDALEIALRAETITGAPPSQQPRDSEALRIAVPVQVKRSGQALRLLASPAANGVLDGADAKVIMFTCHQVLASAGDPRAAALLDRAHAVMKSRAATINDPALRQSFLTHISEHREILMAWQKQREQSAG